MYDINQDKLHQILSRMESALHVMERVLQLSEAEFAEDELYVLAGERAIHVCLEAMADAGNMLIDGFIMRDPGSYEDIIEILRDEQVIPEQDTGRLKDVMKFRKPLIHQYDRVNHQDMYQLMERNYSALKQFAPHIKSYIKKELF